MMNWKLVSEKWNQISSQVKAQWDKLTDEDLKEIDGSQESLIAKLQERYGFLRMDAEKKVADWGAEFSGKLDNPVQVPAIGKMRDSSFGDAVKVRESGDGATAKPATEETPEAPELDQRMKVAEKEEPEEPTTKLNPQVDRSAESRNRPSAVDNSIP